MAEKTEESESRSPVFTFLRSIAQTVTHFPPSIIAETRVKICQLVAQIDYQVACYSCHGNVPPAPC